ncbi:hypothetical protein FGB62_60g00 [Gracilaria domingensis]|nr:hypothetical protein FGB62_60g00 [Gracilaria domingensis]
MVVSGRTTADLRRVSNGIEQSYIVGEWKQTPETLIVNSTSVQQSSSVIDVCISDTQRNIGSVELPPGRRKQISEAASASDIRSMRAVAGKIGQLYTAVYPKTHCREPRATKWNYKRQMSWKQRLVSTSVPSAETIAATAASGIGLPITLVVDSKGLHRCISTQSQTRDAAVTIDVHKLRLMHINGDLDRIVWIHGIEDPVDALTKPLSGATSGILEAMVSEGLLMFDMDNLRNIGIAKQEEIWQLEDVNISSTGSCYILVTRMGEYGT